jgi:large subunit ribosomal protein L25
MELKIFKRSSLQKKVVKDLRRSKDIPAVLYAPGKENENIFIKGAEFSKNLAKIEKGHLSTTVFTLKTEDNRTFKALVKDIQYGKTNYAVLHIDFLQLQEEKMINVRVPIKCIGTDVCPGIKLGGNLRHAIRKIKVRCFPKDLPLEFIVDVKSLNLLDKIRINEINMPQGVTSITPVQEVAIVIAKR